MSNPLTPLNDALAIAEDSFHIARACAIGKLATPVTGTQFHPPDASFADHLIDLARTELEDLFVLAMTATFEARLKEYLKSQASIAPGIYQAKIEEWIAREIESAPLQGLAGIFKPPVPPALINDVDAIRKYRNWVAHGRLPGRKPAAVSPSIAYNTLTQFLTTANII